MVKSLTFSSSPARQPLKPHKPMVAGVVVDSINPGSVKKAKASGADILELRIDTFADRNPLKLKNKILETRKLGLPLLLTIRSEKEGGKPGLQDSERLALFTELIPITDMVDVELSSKKILRQVRAIAKKHKKTLIISFHDFKSTPGEKRLLATTEKARAAGADIVKIAAFAKTREHIKRLTRLVTDEKSVIVIAMGECGKASRVFFPLLGSLVTYAAITKSSAPGQMTLKELKKSLNQFTVCGQ